MTYFKDIGKGCKDFFKGRPDTGATDFNLGQTWSLSVNQGAQTIEGKRNGRDGFIKYSQKKILPAKFAKFGGNLEVKLTTNAPKKDAKTGTTEYSVDFKKITPGIEGLSLDVGFDGNASQNAGNTSPLDAFTVKAKYGKLKDINIYATFDFNSNSNGEKAKKDDGTGGSEATKEVLLNGTYQKGDFVFGAQAQGNLRGSTNFAGYGLAAQWTRSEFNTTLSAELSGKGQNAPDKLVLKCDKKVSDDFSCYIEGDFGGISEAGTGGVTSDVYLGGDFAINESSALQLAVSNSSAKAGAVKLAYTHKLGDNLTGSISFDSSKEADKAGNLFSDGRIGWKLAFA